MSEIPASFLERLRARSARTYAEFFGAQLQGDEVVLDCGCGEGAISLGLAEFVPRGRVVGVDLDASGFDVATAYAAQSGVYNVSFQAASVTALPFDAGSFSACLCHSALETLEDPLPALSEIARVLRPGSVLGVASVDYGGLILAGPQRALLQRFYTARERVWELLPVAAPRRGRELRGLLHAAGFEQIEQHAAYVSHGSAEAVARFGAERAADCRDPWFVAAVTQHEVLSRTDLVAMHAAWLQWSVAPDAFAAFAWCRALARKA